MQPPSPGCRTRCRQGVSLCCWTESCRTPPHTQPNSWSRNGWISQARPNSRSHKPGLLGASPSLASGHILAAAQSALSLDGILPRWRCRQTCPAAATDVTSGQLEERNGAASKTAPASLPRYGLGEECEGACSACDLGQQSLHNIRRFPDSDPRDMPEVSIPSYNIMNWRVV